MLGHLPILNAYPFLKDIPGADQWVSLYQISDGDSPDLKFRVKDKDHQRYLVRLTDRLQYDRKKSEFELLQLIFARQVPIPRPVRFGLCNQGQSIFTMSEWIYGKAGAEHLIRQPGEDQYAQGIDAAVYLKTIHGSMAPPQSNNWPILINRKIIHMRHVCRERQIRAACADKLLDYLAAQSNLVANRPLSLLHGDFHIGNMVMTFENSLHLIDFEKWKFGDPISDMGPMVARMHAVSVPFMMGVLDCYFNFQISVQELRLLAFYAAIDAVACIVWAAETSPDRLPGALLQARNLLKDYNHFRSIVPIWYKRLPEIKHQGNHHPGILRSTGKISYPSGSRQMDNKPRNPD